MSNFQTEIWEETQRENQEEAEAIEKEEMKKEFQRMLNIGLRSYERWEAIRKLNQSTLENGKLLF
jgi:hypothetical protein